MKLAITDHLLSKLIPRCSNLWKESLNGDGQQFHQNQDNEQSSLILTHWMQQKTQHNIWLGTGIQIWRGYTGKWDPNPLFSSFTPIECHIPQKRVIRSRPILQTSY